MNLGSECGSTTRRRSTVHQLAVQQLGQRHLGFRTSGFRRAVRDVLRPWLGPGDCKEACSEDECGHDHLPLTNQQLIDDFGLKLSIIPDGFIIEKPTIRGGEVVKCGRIVVFEVEDTSMMSRSKLATYTDLWDVVDQYLLDFFEVSVVVADRYGVERQLDMGGVYMADIADSCGANPTPELIAALRKQLDI